METKSDITVYQFFLTIYTEVFPWLTLQCNIFGYDILMDLFIFLNHNEIWKYIRFAYFMNSIAKIGKHISWILIYEFNFQNFLHLKCLSKQWSAGSNWTCIYTCTLILHLKYIRWRQKLLKDEKKYFIISLFLNKHQGKKKILPS